MPLCPWFELGLVDLDDIHANNDDDSANKNDNEKLLFREKRELHPKWEMEESELSTQQQQEGQEGEACRLLKRLKRGHVRTSAFKIMTKVRSSSSSSSSFCKITIEIVSMCKFWRVAYLWVTQLGILPECDLFHVVFLKSQFCDWCS